MPLTPLEIVDDPPAAEPNAGEHKEGASAEADDKTDQQGNGKGVSM